MEDSRKKNDRKSIYIVILVLLVAALAGVTGYFIYDKSNTPKEEKKGSAYVDADASSWDDGIDEPADTQGRILVPGYSGAQMKAGDKVLQLSIGNPKENTCYLQATLQLEDGTVLYESGLLEPGTGYQEIELKETLSEGTYQALVRYQGYSMDKENTKLNSCDSAFTLTVRP